MKYILTIAFLLLLACNHDTELTGPGSSEGIVRIEFPTGYIAASDTLKTGKIAKSERLNQLEVRILAHDNTVLQTHTPASETGDYEISLSVKAQENLKILCLGYIAENIKYVGIDEDVDVYVGKNTTATITGWFEPFQPILAPIHPNPNMTGNYTVTWSTPLHTDSYVLQEADDTSFSNPRTISTGSDTLSSVISKTQGQYFYRVKATSANYGISSGWSTMQSITVSESVTQYAIEIVQGSDQEGYPGQQLPLQVKVIDALQNPQGQVPVIFEITTGSGSLIESEVLTGADGTAETVLILGNITGTCEVEARIGSVTDYKSVTFTSNVSLPFLEVVSGNRQFAFPGESFPKPIQVRATTQNGSPIPSLEVTLTVTEGTGELTDSILTTNVEGLASTTLTAGNAYGTVIIRASIPFEVEPIELNAVVSTDERIAFQSKRDGNWEIYTMNTDGSGQINLTNNPGYDGRPSWSPDGSKIAFTSDRDGSKDIFIMDTDGTNICKLTETIYDAHSPAWSPDGTRIVYESVAGAYNYLYIMDIDSSETVKLTNGNVSDRYPHWSPDGNSIVFSSSAVEEDENGLYCIDSTGSNRTQLLGDAQFAAPEWSPDGNTIVFEMSGENRMDIFIINNDGTNIVNLTNDDFYNCFPTWSPDASRIIFTSDRQGIMTLYTMNTDGTNIQLLLPLYENANPSWSTSLR